MRKLLLTLCTGALLLLSSAGSAQERTALSVADAVSIALENHPAARSASAALDASRGQFWRAISPPPPSLSLDYGYVPLGRPLNAFGEKTVEVSQTLEFPLTTIAKGTGLSREISAREQDVASARLDVAAEAKLAYVLALASEERLALATENLAIADSFLRDARTRKNVGEGTQLELLTAQVQRTQAANTLETAHAAVTTARSELRGALGWSAGDSILSVTLSDSLDYHPLDLQLDSLQHRARRLSPQLLASESRIDAASAGRTAAWMSLLPSLDFSYYRQTVGDNPNLYGMKFGISLPIWFLLDTRGQVQQASAEVAIASEAMRSAQQRVDLEVTSAYAAYANSRRQVELQRLEILPQAEEIYRVASISYVAGEISYVEYLQALQGYNTARTASIDALVDYNTAVIRLERIAGGAL